LFQGQRQVNVQNAECTPATAWESVSLAARKAHLKSKKVESRFQLSTSFGQSSGFPALMRRALNF
jgi:hypothetical protein